MKASKIQNLLALSIVVILGFSNFALAQLSCSQASSCAVIGTPNPLACTSGVTFREDFTESGSPGFDSNHFVHSISGNTAFDNEFSGSNPLAPFPSSPDALILFVAQDDITFSLASGDSIESVRVFGNGYFGEGCATFEGANGTVTCRFPQGLLQWTCVQAPSSLGTIHKVTLTGGEVRYDNVEIEVQSGGGGGATAGILVRPKKINANLRRGNVRVVALTDSNFDATTIDPSTIQFGHASSADLVRMVAADEEGDGDIDLFFLFRYTDVFCDPSAPCDSAFVCNNGTSILFHAKTFSGEDVEGIGAIELLGC